MTTLAALGSLLTAPAFAFDAYNAKYLNTQEAKAATLARVCATPEAGPQATCERWRRNGVPDSDIRLGIASVALVAGAAAGGFVVAKPAAVGLANAVKIGTWTPNVVQGAVAAGVTAGIVTYGVTNLVK